MCLLSFLLVECIDFEVNLYVKIFEKSTMDLRKIHHCATIQPRISFIYHTFKYSHINVVFWSYAWDFYILFILLGRFANQLKNYLVYAIKVTYKIHYADIIRIVIEMMSCCFRNARPSIANAHTIAQIYVYEYKKMNKFDKAFICKTNLFACPSLQ